MKNGNLTVEKDNIMTENLDILINIYSDNSKDYVQVNMKDIEEELVLQESNSSGEVSVEENLKYEQNNMYNPCATEILGDKYEEMIDASGQFNNFFRKISCEQQKQKHKNLSRFLCKTASSNSLIFECCYPFIKK
jgi:hypothetical protein